MKRRKKMRLLMLGTASVVAAISIMGVASAGSGNFAILNGTVASGGGTVSSGCYTLTSTVGEPAAGVVANGEFTLTSGFLATTGTTSDVIFKDGFDENTGACSP
jgi:hypothetical protein